MGVLGKGTTRLSGKLMPFPKDIIITSLCWLSHTDSVSFSYRLLCPIYPPDIHHEDVFDEENNPRKDSHVMGHEVVLAIGVLFFV